MSNPRSSLFSPRRSSTSMLCALGLLAASSCVAHGRIEGLVAWPSADDEPVRAAGAGPGPRSADGSASESAEALAKKLANPVASLVSVPFQFNFDRGYGPRDEGERYNLNVQPVVPFDLNEEWNLISRTILPIVYADDVVPGESEFGLGDILQSLFFSPKEPSSGGWIWGVGPALLLPTATDPSLGAEKFGLGPTGVALRQSGPWTYGVLANHIWSIAGDEDRPEVNASFLQPFGSYTTKNAISFTLNTEASFDWRSDQWTIPVNALVTKVTKVGDQLISIGGGLRYWAESPRGGPEGLGVRVVLTLLF